MRLSARERGRRRPIHHPAVARALQEVDAGHHRVTQQRRHREDQRPRDHPVDEELVLGRIDRGHAVVVAFEVQSARRDDALQRFERRARRAGARRARLRADERARHLALERGRRPVRAQRRAGDLHLGRGLRWTGCAGFARRERHERSGRQRTGALRQERSAVEQPVARSLAGLVETAFTAWWAHRCPPRRGDLRAEGSRAAQERQDACVGYARPSYTPTVMTARGLPTVLLGLALLSAIAAPPAAAIVSRVTVQSREDVLGGRPFGAAGGYEKLAGVVVFALDPANAANAAIVDLARAPRDASGRVIASANFMVLRPKTMPRERAVALLEVSNRGGKAALPYFARAAWSADPAAEAAFGDALPLRLGLTLIWVGWQFDVPLRDGVLGLDAPVATDGGRPIEGLVRCDWTVDERTVTLPLGHRNHPPRRAARSSTGSSCTRPAPGAAASITGSRNPHATPIGSPHSSIRPTSSRSPAEVSAIRRPA